MKTITLARKPLVGTVAKNVLEHGSGGINIASTRVGSGGDKTEGGCAGKVALHGGGIKNRASVDQNVGRFPANLILQHLDECRRDGVKRVKGSNPCTSGGGVANKVYGVANKVYGPYGNKPVNDFTAPDGKESVANWVCEDGCPVEALDKQSGILKTSAMNSIAKGGQSICYGKQYPRRTVSFASEGGASRFFKQVKK